MIVEELVSSLSLGHMRYVIFYCSKMKMWLLPMGSTVSWNEQNFRRGVNKIEAFWFVQILSPALFLCSWPRAYSSFRFLFIPAYYARLFPREPFILRTVRRTQLFLMAMNLCPQSCPALPARNPWAIVIHLWCIWTWNKKKKEIESPQRTGSCALFKF